MHACMHVAHIHTHARTHTHTRIHAHTHTRMHTFSTQMTLIKYVEKQKFCYLKKKLFMHNSVSFWLVPIYRWTKFNIEPVYLCLLKQCTNFPAHGTTSTSEPWAGHPILGITEVSCSSCCRAFPFAPQCAVVECPVYGTHRPLTPVPCVTCKCNWNTNLEPELCVSNVFLIFL